MAEDKGNFFVHRPIVAIVIAIVIVIMGTVALIGLPIEQYPNLTPPIVQVSASYTGANAIALAVNEDFKGLLEKSYDSAIWTTIIDPKVTLDFFHSQTDIVLIHYKVLNCTSAL